MTKEQTNSWEEEFVEKGAELEHTRWSKWQQYLHSKCCESATEGYVSFPKESFKHWERQINTPYSELTEREKESDRKEVRQYLPLIQETISQEKEKWVEEIKKLKYQQPLLGTPLYVEELMNSVNQTIDEIINLLQK